MRCGDIIVLARKITHASVSAAQELAKHGRMKTARQSIINARRVVSQAIHACPGYAFALKSSARRIFAFEAQHPRMNGMGRR